MAGRPPRLTAQAVREIRAWHEKWCRIMRPQNIAKKHGISRSMLDEITERRAYRWVP